MTVKRNPDGTWGVYRGPQGTVDIAGPFATMAEAWRWIDRHTGDPISRVEQTSQWSWNKGAHGA
jgi:hypothetical protein